MPVVGGRAPLDLLDVAGADRLVTMAVLALTECTSSPVGRPPVGPPLPILLCLPQPTSEVESRAIIAAIATEMGALIDPVRSRAFATGRASMFDALIEADRLLATRTVSAVYVGGVDSLVDQETFDRLLRAGRLKTSTTEGFLPGEGAAFLRVAREGSADAVAAIAGIGRAQEPNTRGSERPNVGEGLAAAARSALDAAGVSMDQVGWIAHDGAGDRFGFREAAMAITRLEPRVDPAPTILTTASCAGELGAAFGPFALAMAAFFLRRGISVGPAAMVLGTSEGSARGAAVLTRSPAERGAR